MWPAQIDPFIALGVVVATAATDAAYVMFSSSVANRRRMSAANWSSVWYVLSSFAVISYTNNWVYVCFAAIGSWIGAYASMTFLRREPGPPTPLGPAAP
jgi:cell division protein FtsX